MLVLPVQLELTHYRTAREHYTNGSVMMKDT